jgi:hypothetical protein
MRYVDWLLAAASQHNACRGADQSLARPTSRCILFDGENIAFDASLVIYIYIYIYIVMVFLQL